MKFIFGGIITMEQKQNVDLDQSKEISQKPSLLGVIWSPSVQFDKIRNTPKIWIPLLIITIMYIVGTYLTFSQFDFEALLGETVPEEQMEIMVTISKITGAITGVFIPIFSVLISSAIYLLISKIAKSDVTFKQLFSLNTYILFVSAIGILFNSLIHLLIDGNSEIYVTSLAGVIGSTNAVLAGVEIFSIWGIILTAIGLQKVARLSKGLSWTVALIFFIFGLGIAYFSTIINGIGM